MAVIIIVDAQIHDPAGGLISFISGNVIRPQLHIDICIAAYKGGLRDGRGAIKDFRLESIDLFSNELSHSVMEPDTIPSRICKDNRPLFVRGTP